MNRLTNTCHGSWHVPFCRWYWVNCCRYCLRFVEGYDQWIFSKSSFFFDFHLLRRILKNENKHIFCVFCEMLKRFSKGYEGHSATFWICYSSFGSGKRNKHEQICVGILPRDMKDQNCRKLWLFSVFLPMYSILWIFQLIFYYQENTVSEFSKIYNMS